jgi:transcriptional regulator with XRE-family HTH domain
MTLDEVGQRIGAAPGTVIQIEKGTRTVGVAELLALASTLGVSVAWFFTDPPPCSISEPGAAPLPENVAGAERFLTADARIADPKPRRDILGLIKAAATE